MTFQELQDAVMGRLNLTSPEARTRIKRFLNQRYRNLQTSVGLGKVRRTIGSFNTVNGTDIYTNTQYVKFFQLSYPNGNRVLGERTEDQLREQDPDFSQTGEPRMYAVQKYGASSVTFRIVPKPSGVYTVAIDGLAVGTNMSADGDIPAFPEDFHDILDLWATADEFDKMEKPDQATKKEKQAERRMSELRYFLAKSAYLHKQQGTDFWWWGPYPNRPYGWM